MERREAAVRPWFDMWLQKRDLGILDLFAPDAVYTESRGPEYAGAEAIRHWFEAWNTRGTVLLWEIQQFLLSGDQTAVERTFRNRLDDGSEKAFDGVSLIRWTPEGQIRALKEFGCSADHYAPYGSGPRPAPKGHLWF